MGQLAPEWWRHGVRWSEWGHAPFESLLETPRREVEPRTGRSVGQSPALRRAKPRSTKGGQHACVGWLVVGRKSHRNEVRPSLVVGHESDQEDSLSFSFSRSCARGPVSVLLEEAWTGGAAEPAVGREPAPPCRERRRELTDHARGPKSGAATQGRGE